MAEALGRPYALRRVRPRRVFAALAPWGPADPGDAAGILAPPFPALCLATGRRAIPYVRRLKALAPSTRTVLFKDPRTSRHGADRVFVQEHDRLRGAQVAVTTTSPHRFSQARLSAARDRRPEAIMRLPAPRVAVLVGGDSRHHVFRPDDVKALAGAIRDLAEQGLGIMITLSRRTPEPLAKALRPLGERANVLLWSGGADNPLESYLAFADHVVVSADSINMIGEAAATGAPIHVFHPSGGHRKTTAFLEALSRHAVIRPLSAGLGGERYPPVDATPAIADQIRRLAFDR